MKWTTFFMILICAALAFGGSFTCHGNSGDTDISTSNP